MMLRLKTLYPLMLSLLGTIVGFSAWGGNNAAAPMIIEADMLTYETQKKQARGVGNVTASQGTWQLTSPIATAQFKDGATENFQGSSSGVMNNKLESIKAEGSASKMVILSDTEKNSTVQGSSAMALIPQNKVTFKASPATVITLETPQTHLTCTATMDYNNKDSIATAMGNVVARNKKDGAELYSDKMVVYFEQEETSKNTNTPQEMPKGDTQKIKRAEAYGSVIMKKGPQSVTGDIAIHDVTVNIITFSSTQPNGVVVKDGKNIVTGQHAIHNIDKGTTQVSAQVPTSVNTAVMSSQSISQMGTQGSTQVRALLSSASNKTNP